MKMTFDDLKNHIIKYITKPHHHSTWNLKYLHFSTSWDKSPKPNKHYYVIYGDKSRKFKIAMCNNNIKLKNASNIPGSFHDNKGRILGACLDFVRHGNAPAFNDHNYSKDCKANKWSHYDDKMFDKNSLSNAPVTHTNNPQTAKKLAKQGATLLHKSDKATFDKDAKDVVRCVNSLSISKAFKQLVSNMQKCNFTLIGYSQHQNSTPIAADFISSRGTCLSFNLHKSRATISNTDGLNLVKLAKPKLYVRDYYAAIKGAQKDKNNYSFKL